MDDSNYFEALMMGGAATLGEGKRDAAKNLEEAKARATKEVEESVSEKETEIYGDMIEYRKLRDNCGLFKKFIQVKSSEGGGDEG